MLQNHATLQQVRSHLLQEFRKKYVEGESASMVRLVLEHVGYTPADYLGQPDHLPGTDAVAQFNEIVSEIHTGKPIQYILAYTHFFDMQLKVNEDVLIPRPETEEMVHRIVTHHDRTPERIMDLGTGSGCIALALKKQFPEASVSGFDMSRDALKVASDNARMNGLEVHWTEGNLLNEATWSNPGRYDLIVSNPPYVLESERRLMKENVLDFEPGEALFVSDEDPLEYYRAILSFCSRHLSDGGSLWLEINERLGNDTARLVRKAGFSKVEILKDIHEKERFIRAQ